MSKPFFERLKEYYEKVGAVLRGEADAASIFLNTTDIGMERERVYGEFLKGHLPTSCNVTYGGFLFDMKGRESRQIDIIVTVDSCPQYNPVSDGGVGKSFSCVEGTLGIVSVKSNLDSRNLEDALMNIASIPPTEPLGQREMPLLKIQDYEDWPFKILFAFDGISRDALQDTMFKVLNREKIPISRAPNLIHVAGKYILVRTGPEGAKTREGDDIPANAFFPTTDSTDVFGLCQAIHNIQKRSLMAKFVLFNYSEIVDNLPF